MRLVIATALLLWQLILKFKTMKLVHFLTTQQRSPLDLMYKISDEDLCRTSDAIIVGKVIDSSARWDDDHNRIYTYITIEVHDVLKGKEIGSKIVSLILILGSREVKGS